MSVIALLVGLLRILFVLLVVRLVGRFVVAAIRGYRGEVGPPPPRAPIGSRDLVRDRICNTFVARDRAVVATVGGESESFCSTTCRDAALADAATLPHG